MIWASELMLMAPLTVMTWVPVWIDTCWLPFSMVSDWLLVTTRASSFLMTVERLWSISSDWS